MKKLVLAAAMVATLALCSVAAAASLSGTFKRKISHVTAFSGALNGTWTISLSGGKYKVAENGAVLLNGKYSVSGNKITIGGGGSGDFCRVKGLYSFTLSGSDLYFKRIKDQTKACRGRVDVLTNGAFVKE
jgi:hypothetical protein